MRGLRRKSPFHLVCGVVPQRGRRFSGVSVASKTARGRNLMAPKGVIATVADGRVWPLPPLERGNTGDFLIAALRGIATATAAPEKPLESLCLLHAPFKRRRDRSGAGHSGGSSPGNIRPSSRRGFKYPRMKKPSSCTIAGTAVATGGACAVHCVVAPGAFQILDAKVLIEYFDVGMMGRIVSDTRRQSARRELRRIGLSDRNLSWKQKGRTTRKREILAIFFAIIASGTRCGGAAEAFASKYPFVGGNVTKPEIPAFSLAFHAEALH